MSSKEKLDKLLGDAAILAANWDAITDTLMEEAEKAAQRAREVISSNLPLQKKSNIFDQNTQELCWLLFQIKNRLKINFQNTLGMSLIKATAICTGFRINGLCNISRVVGCMFTGVR
jgi:hypothetical protein